MRSSSATDRNIIDAHVEHRVATVAHLNALLGLPERTLRYRLTRLRELRYARAVTPPAEKGSSPDHWAPTRQADGWARGHPTPKGGERRALGTTFVVHAAALTGLYVALRQTAPSIGLTLAGWARETEAKEEFIDLRETPKKIVPDGLVVLAHDEGEYRAFFEVDLGSMSMNRLSKKLAGYAAYYAVDAWRELHPFPPVLLVLTTTEQRAEAVCQRFAQQWARAERLRDWSPPRKLWLPVVAACDAARLPEQALNEPVWLTSDGADGANLLDLLHPVWERWAAEQARVRAEEEEHRRYRERLLSDPEALRDKICHEHGFADLAEALSGEEGIAMEILLSSVRAMDETERSAFRFFSERVRFTRYDAPEASHDAADASDSERAAMRDLVRHYLSRQRRVIAAAWARCPQCPSVLRAIAHLDKGGLLRHHELRAIDHLIEKDRQLSRAEDERRRDYLEWRARRVEDERLRLRGATRLLFSSARAAARIDHERLRFCAGCGRVVIPIVSEPAKQKELECGFCGRPARMSLAQAIARELLASDDGGFWVERQGRAPGWVEEEASRPLVGRIEQESRGSACDEV